MVSDILVLTARSDFLTAVEIAEHPFNPMTEANTTASTFVLHFILLSLFVMEMCFIVRRMTGYEQYFMPNDVAFQNYNVKICIIDRI